jgi:glycosyltransferase involved in cell wall biosynthesis
MPRVLVAPAGSWFSALAGSEDGWIYDVIAGVGALEPRFQFTCITEKTDGAIPDGIRTVGIGRRRTEEVGGLLLPFRIARAAKSVGPLDSFDVVHHGLPFAIGRSFSTLTARAHRQGVPVVVGPVQTPLEWMGSDEDGGQLVAKRRGTLRRATTVVARTGAPVIAGAFSRFSAATLCRADRVVAVGQPARVLLESVGVAPQCIETIPPPSRWSSGAPADRTAGSGPLRVVTAGYLIERKAVEDIVTVVADLATSGEDVVLEVAGDGPAAAALHELCRRHRGGEAIRFHGWLEQSEVSELLRSADAYVSMSRGESWGQACADALAASLVVVSSANVGARSMAEMGAPLRLVPMGDRRHLAAELQRLCHMGRDARREEGAAGARWAAQYIAAPVVAARWAGLYHQVIEERTARDVVAPRPGRVVSRTRSDPV